MHIKLSADLAPLITAALVMLGTSATGASADPTQCSSQEFSVEVEQIGAATLAADLCGPAISTDSFTSDPALS